MCVGSKQAVAWPDGIWLPSLLSVEEDCNFVRWKKQKELFCIWRTKSRLNTVQPCHNYWTNGAVKSLWDLSVESLVWEKREFLVGQNFHTEWKSLICSNFSAAICAKAIYIFLNEFICCGTSHAQKHSVIYFQNKTMRLIKCLILMLCA